MNVDRVIENIEKCVDGLGARKLLGVNLEDVDPRLLDPREGDLNEHVAIQPSAVAYYGVIYKTLLNTLDEAKREYELWRNAKYLDAKAQLGSKAPIKDVEAYLDTHFSKEVLEFEKKIRSLQQKTDDIGMYYEAWRQKSFTIKIMADADHEEFMTTDHYSSKNHVEKPQQSFNQAKDSIRQKMNNGNGSNKGGEI